MPMNKTRSLTANDGITSSVSGVVIGFLSGLIGIGGGEYRAPILIYLLRMSAKFAIAANLLIGFLTVSASFLKREGWLLPKEILLISLIMIVTSIFGSYIAAHLTKNLTDIILKRSLGVLLIVASVKVFLDSHNFVEDFNISIITLLVAAVVGFLIGGLSGFLGVAGGEFRIPALLIIFGIGIKIAGTANLLISIPTVLAGFAKHKKLNHVDRRSIRISLLMGMCSIIGAYIGASLFYSASEKVLLIILSFLMLSVGIKMFWRP